MKAFMDEDFLLETKYARKLYRKYAKGMPILDYHCHINPKEIAQDRRFENITELWLSGDHYKWRQMRSNGVEEYYITGDAPPREKFLKWAATLEKLIGNPLYHWSHLELKRYFGYQGCLNKDTAEEVWQLCNAKLKEPQMSARGLIRQSGVTLLCTTDDPADSLAWHRSIKEDASFETTVLPAWRPDQALHIEAEGYPDYIRRLGTAGGMEINSFSDLKQILSKRMDVFSDLGCRVSDHGLAYVAYHPIPEEEADGIFGKALAKKPLLREEIEGYQTALLLFLGREYCRRGWVMQLHYGCRRNNNRAMFEKLGPDTGFDCIENSAPVSGLVQFLDALALENKLPKTILYSLNPNDDAVIGTLIGCFQDASVRGKLQQGSAWWFGDHKEGMIRQMTSLASLGILSNFVGMLTDSRSFLSYTRHEYFRRILCNLIGGWVKRGEYPPDERALEQMIKGICYWNAVEYFGFGSQLGMMGKEK